MAQFYLSLSVLTIVVMLPSRDMILITNDNGAGNILSGLILGLRPANERRRYFVTASLIGWAHA